MPLPDFATELLAAHREAFPPGLAGEVFTNTSGEPLRRTLFRARVWRPALVRAGLLARIDRIGHLTYRAAWTDAKGFEWSADFTVVFAATVSTLPMALVRLGHVLPILS